mgnify:CR=1 FL=1
MTNSSNNRKCNKITMQLTVNNNTTNNKSNKDTTNNNKKKCRNNNKLHKNSKKISTDNNSLCNDIFKNSYSFTFCFAYTKKIT